MVVSGVYSAINRAREVRGLANMRRDAAPAAAE